ncbi:DegV family protein [Brevibacillus sp. HB1.1]|uniref:DegV family protein n=1 Tax=Brevibacillus TaxID=55080 RepID=UPI00036447EB|nr:DegV family protein [Brevibacillus sp. HB1.1]ATF11999.1 DegV family protein [Brevibacillus brevis X23]NTU32111.1 DegV family protein [Brevibacillus sp. HB1.1]
MKKKIAWVTDSTALIPDHIMEEHDIYVVPLEIIFEDGTYEDGIDLAPEQLYQKIVQASYAPKTSQPSLGKFVTLYERLKEEYECAIAVHLSSDLSGTYNTSVMAAKMVDFPVEPVDSKLMSYPITSIILNGIEQAKEGKGYQEIAASLREEYKKFENYILVGSLDQFYKGGRMTGLQYFIGNLLQIKPIFQIKDGLFGVYEKVRTEGKAIKRMLEQLEKAKQTYTVKHVQILHGNVLDKALELKEKIQSKYSDVEVLVGPISSTIGAHAGMGTLALAWRNE